MGIRTPAVGLAAALALLSGCRTPADPPLTIGAAASLEGVLRKAVPPDLPVKFTFAASSLIVQQAAAGAPIDVVITADMESQAPLASGHLLAEGYPRVLLTNAVVLLVNGSEADKVHAIGDLAHVHRIALCEPAVPIGHYARTAMTQAGLDANKLTTVIEPDVRGVFSVVDSGDADAGFVYRTDALRAVHARTALTVPGLQAQYGISVLARDSQRSDVRILMEWFNGAPARAAFQEAGFGPP